MTSRLQRLLAGAALLAAPQAAEAAQFTLLIYETPPQFALRTEPSPAGAAYWEAFAAIGREMGAAGIMKGGAPLGAEARGVTVRAGERRVSAGPHAPSPNTLGGYFVIEVPDLDTALAWAARIPAAATGAVEVRPHFPAPGM